MKATSYGRDLDLNLLRAFVVVADTGSVTQAASQLYLTQPAVSAAIRRLTTAIGAPLFARQGRGLTLTSRGERLLADLRPHLMALVDAALTPAQFDPTTSERTLRLGLSDTTEQWLLPRLLKTFEKDAPKMRLVIVPVQFRTVGDALMNRRVDAAVTVADDLPATITRQTLFEGGFVCIYDPRHASIKKTLTERAYFEHHHVIVSYNGDLRGIVEDLVRKARPVRCSVSSFQNIGIIVEGTSLIATVPDLVAQQILKTHPKLRSAPVPINLGTNPLELLWPQAVQDDDACAYLRSLIVRFAKDMTSE